LLGATKFFLLFGVIDDAVIGVFRREYDAI
jgi:hypothetical protein